MIAQNTVKKYGKWFYAGEEIAEVDKTTSDDFSKNMNPPEDIGTEQNKTYTKTEINRMSTAELKEFAVKQGIANASGMTGAELKKVLITTMGL